MRVSEQNINNPIDDFDLIFVRLFTQFGGVYVQHNREINGHVCLYKR